METEFSLPHDTTPLKVTANLIRLERQDSLLLANSLHLKPVLVRRGREFVDGVLKAFDAGALSRRALAARWPAEAEAIDFLLAHRILVPADESERDTAPVRLTDAQTNKAAGTSLYLLLSQDCNLGCVYCLNGKRSYRKQDHPQMSGEIAFRAVDRCAANIAPGGYLEVAMFGGEPMLNWELAKKTIAYTENVLRPKYPEVDFRYHVTSNMSILPADFIAMALRHRITVLCDIDGVGPVHDACRPFRGGGSSHGTITANVKRLIAAGVPVSLRTTVTALNQDRLEETARHHLELGGQATAFVPVNVVNSDEEVIGDELIPDIGRMLVSLERLQASGLWSLDRLFPFSVYKAKVAPQGRCVLGCGAPYGNTPVVDVGGDVFPCIYLVGIERYHLGNIRTGSYPDNAMLARMVAELHVDRRDDCKWCAWRYLCGGGCPIQQLTIAGRDNLTPKARDYCARINCEYTKKVLEILLWETAERTAQAADGAAGEEGAAAGRGVKYC